MVAQPSISDQNIPAGLQKVSSTWGAYNESLFMVNQILGKLQTATLVEVVSCTNTGGLAAVGTVNVKPLVNQVDGKGNAMPHVTIYNIPYFRIQGGTDAVIIDPKTGDIGICVFANRDISKVKATKKQANPASNRRFSFSDGLYIGGVLNGVPSQYVQFNSAGMTIHSPTKVIINSPLIELTASTSLTINTPLIEAAQTGLGVANFSGSMVVTGDVTAQGTSVHTHVHSGVQSGGSNTGAPV